MDEQHFFDNVRCYSSFALEVASNRIITLQ